MFVFKAPLTPALSPSDGERVSEGRVRGWTNQFGARRFLSPVSYSKPGFPRAASTEYSELPVKQKKPLPPTTSGEKPPGPRFWAPHFFFPLVKSSAKTLLPPEP